MSKKNYIVIVRDHSGSMKSIARHAARDYNDNIAALKEAARAESIDTIVSTIKCGVGSGLVRRDVVNSNVQVLEEITENRYEADGFSTPLFDSVGDAIELLRGVPDFRDPNVSFLVMVITDGMENSSKNWTGWQLAEEIRRLQATDRWTFAFRVPRGGAGDLEQLGVPAGNILEWDQTARGFEVATNTTRSAIGSYYQSRSKGLSSVRTFYTDLQGVRSSDLKATCEDIRDDVEIWRVGDTTELVREFCERRSRRPFVKGTAFYELVKTEPKVQDYKQIAIRDRQTGAVFVGAAARSALGLPARGTARVVPGDHSKFDVFVQSTSVNRKLPPHTRVLYWGGAR